MSLAVFFSVPFRHLGCLPFLSVPFLLSNFGAIQMSLPPQISSEAACGREAQVLLTEESEVGLTRGSPEPLPPGAPGQQVHGHFPMACSSLIAMIGLHHPVQPVHAKTGILCHLFLE